MGEVISGATLFAKIIEKPQSLFDRIWQIAFSETPLETPEQRAGLKVRLIGLASTIKDPHVRAQYRKMLLDRYDETFFSRQPIAQKVSAQIVDMKSFLERRRLSEDDTAILTKLSYIEDDLAEATRLLVKNFSERGFEYQQDLVRMKADILRQLADNDQRGGSGE